MRIEKRRLGSLEKCYAVSLFRDGGRDHLLAASEKVNQCRVYGMDGTLESVVWDESGGTMSLVPARDREGQFLASQRFYSPDDSKEAIIVSAVHEEDGWRVRTLAELPHAHRFDILEGRDKTRYLIACTVKSASEYDGDWRFPGKVYAAEFPADGAKEGENLDFAVLKEDMYRNHGYCRHRGRDGEEALVCSDEGVFLFIPPAKRGGEWTVRQIADMPVSDAVLWDLDGDGEEELLILAPFHGDTLAVCKWRDGKYEKVYEHPEKLGFLHAICPGYIGGTPCVYVGHREEKRDLGAVVADRETGYRLLVIDRDCGPANCVYYREDGVDKLLAANRETDEIAVYEFY